MPTVTVTLAVNDQHGNPVEGVPVIARLSAEERYAGYVVPSVYNGVTNSFGVCRLQVFPNELGTADSRYLFMVQTVDGEGFRVVASVPNRDCALHDLVSVPHVELKADPTDTETETEPPAMPPAPPGRPGEITELGNSAIFRIRAAVRKALDSLKDIDSATLARLEVFFQNKVLEFQSIMAADREAIAGSLEAARQAAISAAGDAYTAKNRADQAGAAADRAEEAAEGIRALNIELGEQIPALRTLAMDAEKASLDAMLAAERAQGAYDMADAARQASEQLFEALQQTLINVTRPVRRIWAQQPALEADGEVTVPENEPGSGRLFLYRDGVLLQPDLDYLELDATTVRVFDAAALNTTWCAVVMPDMDYVQSILTLAMYTFNDIDPFMLFTDGNVEIPEHRVYVFDNVLTTRGS